MTTPIPMVAALVPSTVTATGEIGTDVAPVQAEPGGLILVNPGNATPPVAAAPAAPDATAEAPRGMIM